jgi:hypothetical protein
MANDLSDISDILGAKGDVSDVSDILGAPAPKSEVGTKRSISDIMRGKGLKDQDISSGIEAAKADVRGFTKGVLGAPGALEQFGAYTVPEFFGASKTPEAQRVEILPTPETVGKMMKQVGLGETPEKYKSAESLFEVLGSLYSPPATEAGAIARKTAQETARAVRGAVSPEASLSARMAEPVGDAKVGKNIFSKVTDRLKALREGRSEEARGLFENFYRDAKPVEEFVRQGYLQDLRTALLSGEKTLAPEEKSVLKDAIRRVSEDSEGAVPGIEALDKERRILKESIDPSATGADAIKNSAYKKAHDLLLKNITNRVKSASDTYNRYAQLSEEINQYGTALGRKLTTPAGEFLPEIPKVDPKDVPSSVFKSEDSVAAFKRLSGDEKFVNDVARQHIANELTGDLNPSKVKNYILSNEWLNQVPEVKQELQGLQSELSRGKKLRYGAYTGLGLYAGRGLLDKFSKFFGD